MDQSTSLPTAEITPFTNKNENLTNHSEKTGKKSLETDDAAPITVEDYRYIPLAHEMGYYSVKMTCPHCGNTGWTIVEDQFGFWTWVWVIVNFFCCICLSLAPFFSKQVSHNPFMSINIYTYILLYLFCFLFLISNISHTFHVVIYLFTCI